MVIFYIGEYASEAMCCKLWLQLQCYQQFCKVGVLLVWILLLFNLKSFHNSFAYHFYWENADICKASDTSTLCCMSLAIIYTILKDDWKWKTQNNWYLTLWASFFCMSSTGRFWSPKWSMISDYICDLTQLPVPIKVAHCFITMFLFWQGQNCNAFPSGCRSD